MPPVIFLDRDDTLIRRKGGLPTGDLGDPDLVELLPGAAEGIAVLKYAGFPLAMVTNQGGVARGKYTLDTVAAVNARVEQLLADIARLPLPVFSAIRACPYHPQGIVPEYTREHPCRKPQPGMLLDAGKELNANFAQSWMIGDAERDVEAGIAAGCRTILVGDGSAFATYHAESQAGAARHTKASFRAANVAEAAAIVLRERSPQ